MANPSKAKGTRAETKVVRYLVDHGIHAERKALAGSTDKGDLRMLLKDGTEVTLEVKAGKQTSNYSRSMMSEWREQTLVESINSGCPAMLVIVRYRRAFADTEVWMPNNQWGGQPGWTMVYLDDFVRKIGG